MDAMERPKRELMARLRELRKAEGWVRVEVWLPRHLVPKLRAYVKRITDSGQLAPFKNTERSPSVNKGKK